MRDVETYEENYTSCRCRPECRSIEAEQSGTQVSRQEGSVKNCAVIFKGGDSFRGDKFKTDICKVQTGASNDDLAK